MKYIATLCLFVLPLLTAAQVPPQNRTLAVYPAQSAVSVPVKDRGTLRTLRQTITTRTEAILTVLKLYDLVDRSRVDQLVAEMQFQDVLSDSAAAELGHAVGAELILFPILERYEARGREAYLSMGFKLIEVATTKVVYVRSIQKQAPVSIPTRKQVFDKLVDQVLEDMARGLFIQSGRHLTPYPLASVQADKDAAETATVFAPNAFFVKVGAVFTLVELKTVEFQGQTQTSTLAHGKLRITEKRGDNLDGEVLGSKKERKALQAKVNAGLKLYAVFDPDGE